MSQAFAHAFSTEAVLESYYVRYDMHRTLALVHGRREPGCGIFRARIYARLGDFERAGAACDEVLAYSTDRRERVEAALFRAVFVDRDDGRAREALDAALALAERLGDAVLELHCRGHEIRMETARGATIPDEVPVRRALSRVAKSVRLGPWYLPASSAIPNALHYLALAYAAAGDIAKDEQVHREALEAGLAASMPCNGTIAIVAANLAIFVRNFRSETLRELVARQLATLPPLLEHEAAAGHIRRALLVNEAAFADARDFAPLHKGSTVATIRERTLTLTDCLLFRGTRNVAEFRSLAAECCELADRTDWFPTAAGSDEVLLVAAAVAPHRLAVAEKRAYVQAEDSMFARVQRKAQSHHREPPFDFARGILEKARGRHGEASVELAAALERFRRYGMLPSAAIAGVERFTLSRDPEDLSDAEAMLAAYPRSSMSARLRAALARSQTSEPEEFPYLRFGC